VRSPAMIVALTVLVVASGLPLVAGASLQALQHLFKWSVSLVIYCVLRDLLAVSRASMHLL